MTKGLEREYRNVTIEKKPDGVWPNWDFLDRSFFSLYALALYVTFYIIHAANSKAERTNVLIKVLRGEVILISYFGWTESAWEHI